MHILDKLFTCNLCNTHNGTCRRKEITYGFFTTNFMEGKVMKKVLALVLASVMVISLAACGKKAEAPAATEAAAEGTAKLLDAPIVFKVSYVENPDTAMGTIMPEAFKKAQALCNDEIQFEFYPSAQLGNEADVMEQIHNGAPIIGVAGYDDMSATVPACIPLAVPYVFESIEEVCNFAKSDYFENLRQQMVSSGYVPMCSGSLGIRHFISTSPITCAADIKGKIIRMGNSNPCQSYITVLGGTPATTAWADNYSMLQTGAIDGCEASIDLLWSSSLQEVCTNLCLSGHLCTPFMFVTSPENWAKIPAEYQKYITEALTEGTIALAKAYDEDSPSYVEKFKEAGVTVCENPDIESFKEGILLEYDYLGIDRSEYDKIRAAIKSVM